jgi:hypothetical protein
MGRTVLVQSMISFWQDRSLGMVRYLLESRGRKIQVPESAAFAAVNDSNADGLAVVFIRWYEYGILPA